MHILRFALLFKILTLLKSHSYLSSFTYEERAIYKTMIYINKNFRSYITIDDLANEAGYSNNYFCYLFKKIFSVGANTYINNMRLEYAYNLIISSNISVTEVCFLSGFGSFSMFSRLFKKKYEASPSQLRKA